MRQAWVCEGCGLNGVVDYEPSDGVFAVVLAIRTHHENRLHRITCGSDGKAREEMEVELISEWRFVAETLLREDGKRLR